MGFRIFSTIISFFLFFFLTTAHSEVMYDTQLKGEEFGMGNLLEWSTAMENNSQMFIIEKSEDGVNYENAGFVNAMGNSDIGKSYRYLDVGITKEKTFYRLKQLDLDGRSSYSHTIVIPREVANMFFVVTMNSTEVEKLFEVTVDVLKEGALEYSLASQNGEILETGTQNMVNGLNDLAFSLDAAVEGIYQLHLRLGEEIEVLTFQKVPDGLERKLNAQKKPKPGNG